mmetsp:Transcript_32758/g.96568  ORF Transcript_32758/g.96568 Transcript_32758/m.96568 type:complete len:303 (-) Transcript_32758:286-1194(-)
MISQLHAEFFLSPLTFGGKEGCHWILPKSTRKSFHIPVMGSPLRNTLAIRLEIIALNLQYNACAVHVNQCSNQLNSVPHCSKDDVAVAAEASAPIVCSPSAVLVAAAASFSLPGSMRCLFPPRPSSFSPSADLFFPSSAAFSSDSSAGLGSAAARPFLPSSVFFSFFFFSSTSSFLEVTAAASAAAAFFPVPAPPPLPPSKSISSAATLSAVASRCVALLASSSNRLGWLLYVSAISGTSASSGLGSLSSVRSVVRRLGSDTAGLQLPAGGDLRVSRQMRPAESTLGWWTGVTKRTRGGSNG